MSLRRAVLLCVLIGVAACSRNPERATVHSPTSPSVATLPPGALLTAPVPTAGKLDALFPSRANTFDFFNRLIAKYRDGLRRGPSPTYIDPEGIVVWVQEYFRYVANGCDHATAVQRVFAQIDGNAPGFLCMPASPDDFVTFPPRDQSFAFFQLLDGKYAQMGRPLGSSSVDPEGIIVWVPEYLRYAANACSHETSVANVFTEIDGNPAPAVCFVPPCVYVPNINPVRVAATGGTQQIILNRRSGTCNWTATTNDSFLNLTLAEGTAGGPLNFTVASNAGAARTGTINVRFGEQSVDLVINQDAASTVILLELFDANRSTGPVPDCHIVFPSQQCSVRATSFLPNAIGNYQFTAEYTYGVTKTVTQGGGSNALTINEVCGGPNSTPTGTVSPLVVTVTATDGTGATATVSKTFQIRFFTCS